MLNHNTRLVFLLLFLLLSFEHTYSQILNTSLIPSDDIYSRITDSKGYEWYGTHDGLKRFDGYHYEVFRSDRNNPDLLRSNDVMCLAEHPHTHDIWLGTKNGAYILSTKDYMIREMYLRAGVADVPVDSIELMDKRINSILCMKSGNVLVAYRNQVLELDTLGRLLHRYETHWGKKNRSVVQLLEDSLSCIWTNLWNGGVCRLPNHSDSFIACEWTDSDYPSELQYDAKNGIIIAITNNGQRYHYSLDGSLRSAPPTSSEVLTLPYQYISQEEISHINKLFSERSLCFTKSPDGTIYVGTFDNIYSIHDDESMIVLSDCGRIHDIVIDNDGTIYFISNSKGLCKIERGKAVQLSEGNSFSSLTIDGRHDLWVSNRLGNVYRLSRKSHDLEDDSIAGNLNGDAVSQLRSDGKSRLWIMSRNTLKEYNTENGGCKTINSDELSVGSFQAIYIEDNGIYIEGSEGSVHLKNTEALSTENEIRKISVVSYTLDGQHILMPYDGSELTIPSKMDVITFFVSSFVYENAKHISYAYSIDGGEYHEMDRGVNSFTLNNIPYGTHDIYLKGKDSYGRWSDSFKVLSIHHGRPWYHYVLCALLLIVGVLLIIWYRRRAKRFRRKLTERMKRYEKEKEMLEEKLRSAEAHAREMGYKESNPSENYTSLSFQDKDFVDRCQNLVEKNLSNIEYGVDSLSQDMYMSRMNLYRKLREITGKTPTEFIRDIRLVHSLMLLQTTSYSINEISDLVGFSYPSYFTKCFKDKYKKSPKSFLSDN